MRRPDGAVLVWHCRDPLSRLGLVVTRANSLDRRPPHGVRFRAVLDASLPRRPLPPGGRRAPRVNESAKSGRRVAKNRPRVSHPRDNQPYADEGGAWLSCLSGGGSPQG